MSIKTASLVIGAVVVILMGVGGGYYYFSNSQSQPTIPADLSDNTSNSVAVNTSSENPSNTSGDANQVSSNGAWSSDMCDYFTLAIARANLSTPVIFVPAQSPVANTGCGYVAQSAQSDLVALFTVTYKNVDPSVIKTISQANPNDPRMGTSVQGLGDEAYYMSGKDGVTLSFAKSGTFATINVDEPNGNTQLDLQEAENIASAIISKLPLTVSASAATMPTASPVSSANGSSLDCTTYASASEIQSIFEYGTGTTIVNQSTSPYNCAFNWQIPGGKSTDKAHFYLFSVNNTGAPLPKGYDQSGVNACLQAGGSSVNIGASSCYQSGSYGNVTSESLNFVTTDGWTFSAGFDNPDTGPLPTKAQIVALAKLVFSKIK